MVAFSYSSLPYYAFLFSVLAVALFSLWPRKRLDRRPYRPFGEQTPHVRQDVTLLYGTTGRQDGPGTAGATRAVSPLPRPPGTPGACSFPPPADTTMLTMHPTSSSLGSHSTVWITSGDGAASSIRPYGVFTGNDAA